MIKFVFGDTIISIVVVSIIICAFLFAIVFNSVKWIKNKFTKPSEQITERQYCKVKYIAHGIQASSNELTSVADAISARDSMLFHDVSDLKIVFITEVNGKIVSEKIIDV